MIKHIYPYIYIYIDMYIELTVCIEYIYIYIHMYIYCCPLHCIGGTVSYRPLNQVIQNQGRLVGNWVGR